MFKFDDKLCAECGGITMFSTIKNEGCEVDFEGKWDAVAKRRMQ